MMKYIPTRYKHCYILLLGCVIFSVKTPVSAETISPVIKMITLNLHDGRDEQKLDNLERTVRFFEAEQPDLACLQEVEPKHLKVFQQAGYHVVMGMNANLFPFRFGNAILSRHRVIYNRHLYLPSNLEQRGINLAVIEIGGREFVVINTHLGLRNWERQQQFDEILRIIGYLKHPIIITGDFNVRSAADDLFKGFNGKFTEIGDSFPLPPTFPSSNPKYRIDLVWYSQHWRPVQAEVIPWYGSDHLPVAVEFELLQPEEFSFKAPKIPAFDKAGNPLLPDVGELPTKFEVTATEPDVVSGSITIPITDKIGLSGAYPNQKPALGLNYLLTTIDLRDYASLRGWRGKGEWIFSVLSDFQEETWLEWAQYYRWSNRWGSKITGSTFNQEISWSFEQIYLSSERHAWSTGLNTNQSAFFGFAFTPDKKHTLGIRWDLEDDDSSKWSLKWSYQY